MRHKLLTLVGLYVFEMGVSVRKHPYLFERVSDTALKIGKLSRDPAKLNLPKCNTTYSKKLLFNGGKDSVAVKIPKEIRELLIKLFQKELRDILKLSLYHE